MPLRKSGMSLPYFVSLSLVLTVMWMQFYASVRETYNGLSESQAQIHKMQDDLRAREVNALLQSEHFLEFRQTVD